MEHPIALPYGKPIAAEDNAANVGLWLVCALVFVCSAALVYLCYGTLNVCLRTIGMPCGTPAVSAAFDLLLAPIPLSLPFLKLLWAKRLPFAGRAARCFLTGGLGVWAATMAFLFYIRLV